MNQVNKIKKLENLSYFNKDTISQYVNAKTNTLSTDINRWIKNKSSRIYKNKLGLFIYRNIKDILFTGFNILENNGFVIKEATKAKALFDWMYLKLLRLKKFDLSLLESFRLNLENFKPKEFKEFELYCELTGIKKYLQLT